MAKTAPLARGFGQRVNRQVDSWNAMVAAFKRRLWEALGATLVILCFLVSAALVTYNPADPSFNTAGDAAPGNFLGRDGAALADILVQSLGLAAFLLPLIVLGWAFRLLLQRPLQRMPRRLLLVVPALLLGAFACSALPLHPMPLPAGAGGAIGGGLMHVAQAFGLAALELPLAMGAAALTGLLLLSIMGLSWGDWRDVGSGAGRNAARLAVVSGIGAAAAVGFSARVVARWRDSRRDARAAATNSALGPHGPLPWSHPDRASGNVPGSARPASAPSGARREPGFGAAGRVAPL